MLNNYEINFSISEMISAFFSYKKKRLDFPKKMSFMYEVASGRDAIFTILKDIKEKKGVGEVICPNYSCKAIPRAIIAADFEPVFVDVNTNLSLDVKMVKEAINKKTKAIIFYHPWGFLHSKEIIKTAKENRVLLIEDCAQIIGEEIGNLGDYSFFSFRTSKLISAGSGGVLFSKEKLIGKIKKRKKIIEIIDFIDLLFRKKIKNSPKLRAIAEKIFEKIENRGIGNFQKNLIIIKLKNLEDNLKKRTKNYYFLKKIVEKTKKFKNISLDKVVSPLYFPVLCDKKNKAISLFRKNGINAQGYYSHINSECFKAKAFGNKGAKFFAQKIVNLPLHENLSYGDLKQIARIIIKIDKELK